MTECMKMDRKKYEREAAVSEDRDAEMGSSEMKRLKLERKEQISGEEK